MHVGVSRLAALKTVSKIARVNTYNAELGQHINANIIP